MPQVPQESTSLFDLPALSRVGERLTGRGEPRGGPRAWAGEEVPAEALRASRGGAGAAGAGVIDALANEIFTYPESPLPLMWDEEDDEEDEDDDDLFGGDDDDLDFEEEDDDLLEEEEEELEGEEEEGDDLEEDEEEEVEP